MNARSRREHAILRYRRRDHRHPIDGSCPFDWSLWWYRAQVLARAYQVSRQYGPGAQEVAPGIIYVPKDDPGLPVDHQERIAPSGGGKAPLPDHIRHAWGH